MRSFAHAAGPRCAHPVLRLAACMLLLACVSFGGPAHASESDAAVAERRIKAAFLVKFVEYVEWPAGAFAAPDTPLTVGVVGDDAMLEELQSLLANRRFGARAFDVRGLDEDTPAHAIQVLFVGHGRRAVAESHIVAPTQPVLVVTDTPAGLTQGATINFLVRDAHVQFEASLEDAERRHLKLGSGLLSVARNLRRSVE